MAVILNGNHLAVALARTMGTYGNPSGTRSYPMHRYQQRKNIWLVVFRPTPLKNDGVSSSVGMMIPNIYIYRKIKHVPNQQPMNYCQRRSINQMGSWWRIPRMNQETKTGSLRVLPEGSHSRISKGYSSSPHLIWYYPGDTLDSPYQKKRI